MGEKNVSPVCLFPWTKIVWFLGFLKAWPTQALVRLFGDRKCEVGCGVQTGEMAYIVLTSPEGGGSVPLICSLLEPEPHHHRL